MIRYTSCNTVIFNISRAKRQAVRLYIFLEKKKGILFEVEERRNGRARPFGFHLVVLATT